MARKIVGVVVTIFIIVAALVAFERSFSPSFKACIAKQDNQNGSNPSIENPSGFASASSLYIECTGEFIDKNNGAITAIATIVIAAFTATLWRATTAQSQLAREAFIADKRAFVFASGITPFYEPDPASGHFNWRIGPIWQNSGDTATQGLLLYTDGLLSNQPIQANFDFNAVNPNVPPGPGMLGPKTSSAGGQAPHFPNSALTPQDILDIQQGRKFFYLWGWSRYRDRLPRTPDHISRYCWRILATGDPFTFNPTVDPNSIRFSNVYERRGNCADEECVLQGLA